MKKNRVVVPGIVAADYLLLRENKKVLVDALNSLYKAGQLPSAFGNYFAYKRISAEDIKLTGYQCWFADSDCADIDIYCNVRTCDGECVALHGMGKIWGIDEIEVVIRQFRRYKEEKEREVWRLTKYLYPLLTTDAIEKAAIKMLQQYNAPSLEVNSVRRAIQFAQNIGLKVAEYPLAKKESVALLHFQDSDIQAEYMLNGQPVLRTIHIAQDTIVMNGSAPKTLNTALTIFHECIHYKWHYLFHLLQKRYNEDLERQYPTVKPIKEMDLEKNPLPWIEWQATRSAYCLLLPENVVRPETKKELKKITSFSNEGERYQTACDIVGDRYELKAWVVRARLIQLGYMEAKGALNWHIDHYVRPFGFTQHACDDGGTYMLSPKDMFKLYKDDAEFREEIQSGRYIYTEGHVILNDSQYVEKQEKRMVPTKLALENVSRCCLLFQDQYFSDSLDYPDYDSAVLASDEQYNRHCVAFFGGEDMDDADRYQQFMQVKRGMKQTFGESLIYLMEVTQMTKGDIEEKCGISERTVERMRNDPDYHCNKDRFVALCVGMHLPPMISEKLMEQAGIEWKNTDREQAFDMILHLRFMDEVPDVQKYLNLLKLKPLSVKMNEEEK